VAGHVVCSDFVKGHSTALRNTTLYCNVSRSLTVDSIQLAVNRTRLLGVLFTRVELLNNRNQRNAGGHKIVTLVAQFSIVDNW